MAEARPTTTFQLNVRYGMREPVRITVDRTWRVQQLRQHIANELGIESGAVDLIFAGKDISDENMRVQDVLGEGTYLNAVKASGMVPNYPTLNIAETFAASENPRLLTPRVSQRDTPRDGPEDCPEDNPGAPEAEEQKDSAQSFYVYCRRKCKKVQPAKLRVRCDQCGLGNLLVHRDPEGWDDVLKEKQISGDCKTPNCPGANDGAHAVFFFKCSGHQTGENESLPPLRNIVTNTRNIPCITCWDDTCPELYVFECPDRHVICMDCLKRQCTTKIQDRQFVQTEEHGYTLPCLADKEACRTAYITEPNNFKIVGEDLYARYQNYATQEYTLQQGGVLCPAPNCASGIIPPTGEKRVECRMCKHVFCRECKEAYHEGECVIDRQEQAQRIANDPTVSPEIAARARLECEAYRAIDEIAKQCPSCRANIDKTGGCNHMTCPCGFHFCWLCLTEWKRGGECQKNHWFAAHLP